MAVETTTDMYVTTSLCYIDLPWNRVSIVLVAIQIIR